MATTTDTAVAPTDVYTTFVEEEFGPTELGKTETPGQKNKSKKILWTSVGGIVGVLLMVGIFAITIFAVKQKKALGDAAVRDIVDEPIIADQGRTNEISQSALQRLQELGQRCDQLNTTATGKGKSHKNLQDALLVAKHGLIHLYIVGDSEKGWFKLWTDVVDTLLLEVQVGTDNKITKQEYELLRQKKEDLDVFVVLLQELVEQKGRVAQDPAAQVDIEAMGNLKNLSQSQFGALDKAMRKKLKKEVSDIPAFPTTKTNKAFLKKVSSAFIDKCLLEVLQQACAWDVFPKEKSAVTIKS